jgi:hypothetical protein
MSAIRLLLIIAAVSTVALQRFDPQNLRAEGPIPQALQPGEKEIRGLAAAWPDRVSEIGPRDGDWSLRVGDTWFAWAHGRLLPDSERERWKDFAPLSFYDYPRGIPRLPRLDAGEAARLRARIAAEERHPPRRSEAFLGALLGAPNRASTESRLVRMEVAGFILTVHERLREPLFRVSRELEFLRKTDPWVASFLRQLGEMNGYNYRYVDGTRSRSLHSFGTAIDLIPRRPGGGHSYWRWAMNKAADWWTIPYAGRWMPPSSFVRAFERQGFVWGGKWFYFDTMHFEYRPEILRLRSSPGPLTESEDGEEY